MAEENQDAGTPETQGETLTFEAWFEQQDETTKTLLDKHTAGLKGALDDEKSNRKALAKQIVELSKQAEAGSALKGELDKLTAAQEASNRKSTFYESAPQDVANLRLAWLAAEDSGLIEKDGKANWKAIREQAPELFRKPPTGNAGNGVGTGLGGIKLDMNSEIRKRAGY